MEFVNAFFAAYGKLSTKTLKSSFCPRGSGLYYEGRYQLFPSCPKVYQWFKKLVEGNQVPFFYIVVKKEWREQFKSQILPFFPSNRFLSPPLTDDLITSLFGHRSSTKLIFYDETQQLFIECDTDSERRTKLEDFFYRSDLEELFSIKALLDTVYVDSEEDATIAFKEILSLLRLLEWKGEEGEEEKQYLFHKEVKPLCLSWLGVPVPDKKRKREEEKEEEDKKRKIDVL